MSEINLHKHQAVDELEFLENEEELEEILDEMASHIGWIVILFNSLESNISFCVADMVTHDPYQDDRVSVFLAEMQYSGKRRALINLYGQAISYGGLAIDIKELTALEKTLEECGKRRNEYAHADWLEIKEKRYVCVKTQAKKHGIIEKYRKFDISKMEEDLEYISGAKEVLENFHETICDKIYGRG